MISKREIQTKKIWYDIVYFIIRYYDSKHWHDSMKWTPIYDILVFIYMTLCIIYGIMKLRIGKFYPMVLCEVCNIYQKTQKRPMTWSDCPHQILYLWVLHFSFFTSIASLWRHDHAISWYSVTKKGTVNSSHIK